MPLSIPYSIRWNPLYITLKRFEQPEAHRLVATFGARNHYKTGCKMPWRPNAGKQAPGIVNGVSFCYNSHDINGMRIVTRSLHLGFSTIFDNATTDSRKFRRA